MDWVREMRRIGSTKSGGFRIIVILLIVILTMGISGLGYYMLTKPTTSAFTPIPTPTSSPTPIPTPTSSPTPIPTPTSSPTPIPTPTSSPTPIPTPTSSPTPIPTPTSSPTPIPTPTSSPTPIPTPTSSPTPIPTPTSSPTPIPTPTSSPTPIPTPTVTPTPSPEPSPTWLPGQIPAVNATASSFNGITYGPLNAIDGIESTSSFWGTASILSLPQWLKIDLGFMANIDRVDTHFYDGNQRVYTYYMDVSADNVSWTTVVASKTGSGIVSDTFSQIAARYVRITVINNTANTAAHIEEVRVFQAEQEQVRDAVTIFINSSHPETAQFMSNLAWTGGRVTPQNLIGAETYMYYSQGWNVTINYPVYPNPIYKITADYSANSTSIPYIIIWKGTMQNGLINETSYVFAQ